MLINYSQKYVFLRIPKAASTTIYYALICNGLRKQEAFDFTRVFYHHSFNEVIDSLPFLKDFKVIVSVRDPYHRFVSAFLFAHRNEKDRLPDVFEYLQNIHMWSCPVNTQLFLPMVSYIKGVNENSLEIYKLEDTNSILKLLGNLNYSLIWKTLNERDIKSFPGLSIASLFGDKNLIGLINEIYYIDFMYFGYDIYNITQNKFESVYSAILINNIRLKQSFDYKPVGLLKSISNGEHILLYTQCDVELDDKIEIGVRFSSQPMKRVHKNSKMQPYGFMKKNRHLCLDKNDEQSYTYI